MPLDDDLPLSTSHSVEHSVDHAADYLETVAAIDIVSDTVYRVAGLERDLGRIRFAAPAGMPAPKPTLDLLLRNDIYGLLYKRSTPQTDATRFDGDKSAFLIALSHANTGTGTWEPGWRILAIDPYGSLHVANDDDGRREDRLVFVVDSSEFELVDAHVPRVGAHGRVRIPKELRQLNTYYYMAFGDAPLRDRQRDPEVLLRYYWHLTPAAAVPYMHGITARLNDAGIAFRTKVLSDPQGYGAADAGVLYIDRDVRDAVEPMLMSLHAELAPLLSPSVPLFTRKLAPGLGHAEDPDNGESYGVSRARLAAEGLLRAHAHGETSIQARIARIRESFAGAGLDPDHPHLQPTGALSP